MSMTPFVVVLALIGYANAVTLYKSECYAASGGTSLDCSSAGITGTIPARIYIDRADMLFGHRHCLIQRL